MIGGALQPGANDLWRFFDCALFGKLRQRFLDSGKPLVEIFLLNFKHRHVETSRGRNLRYTGPHQPTAQHANFLDLHKT